MPIAPHLTFWSASLAIALAWEVGAAAQTTPGRQQQGSNLPPLPPVSSEQTPGTAGSQPLSQSSSDFSPQPSQNFRERTGANEPFNPSANPLQFPTKPEEVKIQVREPVSLQQALELGLRNNRELQGARLQLEEARALLEQERADLYPFLDTDFSLRRDTPAAVFERIDPLTQQRSIEDSSSSTDVFGNLRLTYNIYTGGEREASIRRAERQVRSSNLEVERIAEETRFNVTDRYYELQRADAQVAIGQATVEDATQTLRDARLLEQAGLGTRFDVLRAEADLATAKQELTLAISGQRGARRRLAEVLSLGQHVELTAADEIQPAGNWQISLEQSIVQAYKNRAELEQSLLAKEIAEQERYIALAGIKPQVDFLAEYSYSDGFDDALPLATGYNFQTRVTWRFFDGGRAFAGARQADRRMDQADTEFARQRDQIRARVEEAYYSLIANGENIESTRTTVAAREEQLRLARLRFQAGVGTQTEVIDAQRDLARARVDFLNAVVDYNQSLNSLQRNVSNLPSNRLFDVETQP